MFCTWVTTKSASSVASLHKQHSFLNPSLILVCFSVTSLRPSGHLSSLWCASPLWSLHASFSSRRQNCGGAAKAYTTSGTPTPPGHQLPGNHRGHRRSVDGHQQHHCGEDPGVYALVQRLHALADVWMQQCQLLHGEHLWEGWTGQRQQP